MKTQIYNLINGSEHTIRNLTAEKYTTNPVGFYNYKNNSPMNGGTPTEEREETAKAVAAENPVQMHVIANGVELILARHNSTTGKSWSWESPVTAEQYTAIVGAPAPTWTHKGAVNTYGVTVYANCTVEVWAASGKKSFRRVLGEEFIEIL